MLCPEVSNFKAPESTFLCQKYSPGRGDHTNIINNFYYNHLVSVVLPNILKVPERLKEVFDDSCTHYKLKSVKLSEFIVKNFIYNFVNSGNLYVLSLGAQIDSDNCVSVTPAGKLILSLNKSSYQSSGLEGSISHFHTVTGERYIVTIDLRATYFKSGKPNYEKIKVSLEKIRQDVIITWDPPNEDVCSSSIAKYFSSLGYAIELCEVKHKSHILYSVKLPTFLSDQCYNFIEWLGMVALEGNFNGTSGDFVTTYEPPEPNQEVGQVRFLQWRGFFTANQITKLYNRLSEFRSNNDGPFVAMYVQGFSDSSVAWGHEEHHFYTNGDNSYTFILTKDQDISCVQKCSRKQYNKKKKGKSL